MNPADRCQSSEISSDLDRDTEMEYIVTLGDDDDVDEEDEDYEEEENEDEDEDEDEDDIRFEIREANDDDDELESDDGITVGPGRIDLPRIVNIAQLQRLIRHFGGDETAFIQSMGRRERLPEIREPIPNPAGMELMRSGDFGTGELEGDIGHKRRAKRRQTVSERLLKREMGTYTGERSRMYNEVIAQSLVPSSKADFVIQNNDRCYSGQFSLDGNFFYSCSQDMKVRMYDTSNPYEWKYYKSMEYWNARWTITDATLSPDSRMLAYSSITSTVYMSSTSQDSDETHNLEFRGGRGRAMGADAGIWSIRFSGDGQELVAGASDSCLYVYDIEAQRVTLKLEGHRDDVNAVCYGDTSSPHILFSGSDDTTIKVWDRRSMANGREVGVFTGHIEGITYIDSKGDGRYVLSNGKDQTMKLWDIRKMMDTREFDQLPRMDYSSGYDYRMEKYQEPPTRLDHDKSIVTYRGHSVLQTLIRCHFSPQISTGSRYVYTGSADGKVQIYNLDATVAGTIDVDAATKSSRPRLGHTGGFYRRHNPRACVRDVSWHPTAPILAATSWGKQDSGGAVSVHSWDGGKKTSRQVPYVDDDDLRKYTPEMEDLYETADESGEE